MNLFHIQTFLTIVETGKLNKAAQRLNVTQSTVTSRINALEEAIGQKLLRRQKSGAELTAVGVRFHRHAELLMQAWRQARYETSLPRGFDDTFAFACVDALWPGAGEVLIAELRRAQPGMAIDVQGGGEGDVRRLLANAMADVVIAHEPPPASGFAIDVLFEDVSIEVATVRRGLMRWDPLYVYVDLGDDFRRRHAVAYPVDETAVVNFSSAARALDHILACGGSAYLPYRLARPHLEAGRLFEVEDAPRFSRKAYLAHNTARTDAWPWFGKFLAACRRRLAGGLL